MEAKFNKKIDLSALSETTSNDPDNADVFDLRPFKGKTILEIWDSAIPANEVRGFTLIYETYKDENGDAISDETGDKQFTQATYYRANVKGAIGIRRTTSITPPSDLQLGFSGIE